MDIYDEKLTAQLRPYLAHIHCRQNRCFIEQENKTENRYSHRWPC